MAMGVMWLILILGVLKLPLVGLMLWLPFRADQPVTDAPDAPDDGGSKTLPGSDHHGRHPRRPRPGSGPQRPRRGPHGTPAAPPPRRIRTVHAHRTAERCGR